MKRRGLYGTRRSPEIDNWLDNDLEWVTLYEWTATTEVMARVQEMFQDDEGYADWEGISEHLASNEPSAFQVYLDPGNPGERMLRITAPPRERLKPQFTLIQGGKES
jgi:hypothetical protein